MNPSQCSPDDPSGDLQTELDRIATPNPDPCQCPNCRLRRAIRGMVELAEERVTCQQDSPTVSDLGGGAGAAGAGAEPPGVRACLGCGANSWRVGIDGSLGCWTCGLLLRSEGPAQPAAGAAPPAYHALAVAAGKVMAEWDRVAYLEDLEPDSFEQLRTALGDLPEPPEWTAWPEGEDFRLACRQAVLACKALADTGTLPAWFHETKSGASITRPLLAACAILERLEGKQPVPPADLKWRPAPSCSCNGSRPDWNRHLPTGCGPF